MSIAQPTKSKRLLVCRQESSYEPKINSNKTDCRVCSDDRPCACETRTDRAVKVGNMLITNPKGNHPIRVSKQMIEMKIPVRRGDYGLKAEKKMELGSFVLTAIVVKGRAALILAAPSGQPNEVAVVDVLERCPGSYEIPWHCPSDGQAAALFTKG